MSENELFNAACAHFRPGMEVLVPDSGMLRCATVDQIVRGFFNGAPGLGLLVWFSDVFDPGCSYELSWALKYIQVLSD